MGFLVVTFKLGKHFLLALRFPPVNFIPLFLYADLVSCHKPNLQTYAKKKHFFVSLYFYSLYFQGETGNIRGSEFTGSTMCFEFLVVRFINPSKSKDLYNASLLAFYYCTVLLG